MYQAENDRYIDTYLEALVVASATTVVLGKLNDNGVSVHQVSIELVDSLISITRILDSGQSAQ